MSKPTGSPSWTNPPEMFRHQSLGEPQAEPAFWQSVEKRLAEGSAAKSAFVRTVADGSAPIESVREFAHDLRTLCRELPLIQGEIASRAALHGIDTVILLSEGATLAFGYQGEPPLGELVERFATAVGSERPHDEAPALPTSAFLTCVRSLGLEGLEGGVATMLVDDEWRTIAPMLAKGLEEHYAIPASELACFAVLERYSGHRSTEVPALLREIARSAYHQKLVEHGLRETLTVWGYLWEGWAMGKDLIRLKPPTSGGKGGAR